MGTPLYDTSILIDFIRNNARSVEGCTTSLNLIEYPKSISLRGLKVIIPGREDFDKAFTLSTLLLKLGKPLPAIDITISAIAINRGLTLCTKDNHFRVIQEIDESFKVKFMH